MTYWTNKVVVVTGASSGLGRVIARTFAENGAQVILTARGIEKLQQAADEIRANGGIATAIAADVTNAESVERLFAEVQQKHGRLDAIINCAGKSQRRAILDVTAEDARDLLDLNLSSTILCTRAAAQALIASKGHLVNIGSLAGIIATRWLGAYPAAKFALTAYTRQLRLELGPQGLHVLLVCPGPIARDPAERTENASLARPDRDREEDFTNLPESARRPGGGAKTKQLQPDWLAQRILTACERRELELIVPGKARILSLATALSPRLGDWLVKKFTS